MIDFKTESLQPEELDEWITHCGTIFEVGSDYFRRHFFRDPDKCCESIFVIKASNAIVSTVRVFHRHIYLNRKIIKMGGIGEVSTNPDFRSKGYSYALMQKAVEYMKENNFVISMLGTGYFSHYAKHGYVQVNCYDKPAEAGTVICGDFDIRTLTPDNFCDMSELYNKYSSVLNCSTVRSQDYWKSWCAAEIKNPKGLFKKGKLCGYVCSDDSSVTEIIAEGEDYDILLSVVPADFDKNTIIIPAFVSTKRKIAETRCDNSTMINLFSDIEIDGKVYSSSKTQEFAEYINNNGGIVHWNQDHF